MKFHKCKNCAFPLVQDGCKCPHCGTFDNIDNQSEFLEGLIGKQII